MRHGALLALLACGCLADNPDYQPGYPAKDLGREVPDLTVADGADRSADLGCGTGARRCELRTQGSYWESQFCRDGRWLVDRRCPQDSECVSGYCQKPPRQGTFAGKPCLLENDCFGTTPSSYSCQPFVRLPDLTLEFSCAQQIGTGVPGTACKPPDGSGCRSGFCDEVRHPAGGGNNYCYRQCGVSPDCPNNAGLCRDAKIIVEQIQDTSTKSCVPFN